MGEVMIKIAKHLVSRPRYQNYITIKIIYFCQIAIRLWYATILQSATISNTRVPGILCCSNNDCLFVCLNSSISKNLQHIIIHKGIIVEPHIEVIVLSLCSCVPCCPHTTIPEQITFSMYDIYLRELLCNRL